MARTYKRDARGRFASGGTSRTGRTSGGTLGARTSLRKSRGKLAAKDRADDSLSGTLSRRAQKGAVTRGEKRLNQARKASMVKLSGVKRSSTIAKSRRGGNGSMVRSQDPAKRVNAKAASKSGAPSTQSSTPKRKVEIQIKRAKPGGEYGPDGHFYSGGSWMPLGKFQGGGKQMQAFGQGAKGNVKQTQKNDGGTQTMVIKQARKERPPLQPTGPATPAKTKVSKRGEQNMRDFFGTGYYTNYKKGRDGSIEEKQSGWLKPAAMATRFSSKETGTAIVKLRRMAKNKKEFDAALSWERKQSLLPGAYGYEEARRGGYLPRGMTKNQWIRSSQLDQAIRHVASQRAKRPDNRRTSSEEYVWVMNNLIGTRAQRKLSRRSGQSATSSQRGVRGPAMRGVLRPISTRRLVAAGGSRWQKGPHDRVYFNAARSGKVFYDRTTRRMVTQGGDPKKLASEAQQIARAARRSIPRRWKRGRISA